MRDGQLVELLDVVPGTEPLEQRHHDERMILGTLDGQKQLRRSRMGFRPSTANSRRAKAHPPGTIPQYERRTSMRVRFRTSDSRRGAIAILSAFILIFLLAMVAFAVDIGYLCVVQTQAQTVADAAAMAAASGLPSGTATANAEAYAPLNTANGQPVTLQDSDVVLGTWNATNQTFTVLTGSATSSAKPSKSPST